MKKTTAKAQALKDMRSIGLNTNVFKYNETNPCCSGRGCKICK